MSDDERRYDEDEVAAILERAANDEASSTGGAGGTGLTLTQLQEIGIEAGIAPERIAEAARSLVTRPPTPPARTFLGAPRSVSRNVPIPRALDDEEWSRLVVLLRETFGVEGRIRVHGTLRSWNIGNLQVHVEPDGEHYRIRMQTTKGDLYPRMVMGAAGVALGTGLLLTGGGRTETMVVAGAIGLVGLLQAVFAGGQLPFWARQRAAQMEALAERIPRLLED